MSEINFMTEETAQEILGNLGLIVAYEEIYLRQWTLDSWDVAATLGRSGRADKVFEVGSQILSTYTDGANVYSCPWDILGFRNAELEDGTIIKNATVIGMHYTDTNSYAFDPKEEVEATEATAQEGYYYCGYDGTNYTMLGLSAGDTIPYGSYTKVYKTLWNSANPIRYGLNNWKLSFSRQYLNNTGTGWAQAQHACDVLPTNAANIKGFMSYMPADMIAALHPTKVVTKQSTYMGGGTDITYDVFFPLSLSEMNFKHASISPDDGEPLAYYKALLNSQVKVDVGTYEVMKRYALNSTASAQIWWSRSAYLGYVSEWIVGSSGIVTNNSPSNSNRQLPACILV